MFALPQRVKGGVGLSNVWYADDRAQHFALRTSVLAYLDSRRLPLASPVDPRASREVDPLGRQRIERKAIDGAIEHFESLGYSVDSVARDNLGWDLTAVLGRRVLKMEVKGL